MFRAGRATTRLTPPLGSRLAGNAGWRRTATSIHDHLLANAIVCEHEQTRIALVSCDVIGISGDSTSRIRELVAESTEIPHSNVLIGATHTHTGPQTIKDFRPPDTDYLDQMEKQVATAVRLAEKDLAPATLDVARGKETSLSFNRRILTTDGEVLLPTQSFESKQVRGPEGPADPTLDALVISSEQEGVKALVVAYATHTDLVTGERVSADFPGYLRRTLRSVYGEETVVAFFPGTAGNLSAFDPTRRYETRDHYYDRKGPQRALRAGRILGGRVLHDVESRRSEPIEIGRLDTANETVRLKTRKPDAQRLATARDLLEEGNAELRERVLARNILEFASYQEDNPEVATEIQAIRFGDLTFIGLPGEPFVEFGLEIRDSLPETTVIGAYINDMIGYLPTVEAFDNGGYETTTGWLSQFTPDAGRRVTDVAIELAERWHR